MKVQIPQEFLDIAKNKKVPADLAVDYYVQKTSKKSVDNVKLRLVHTKIATNETEAGKLLLDLWKDYTRLSAINPSPEVKTRVIQSPQTYIDRALEELDKIIGPVKVKAGSKAKNNKLNRIAVAGDFHFPFASAEALEALLKDPADTLVIMGDYFDMYSASRFRHTTDRIQVSEELAIGKAYMARLSEKFSKIYMISGNHDVRATRKIQDTYPQILPLIINPVELIAAGFENVEILNLTMNNTTPMVSGIGNINMNFAGTLNDCLFGHFDNFGGPDAPRRLEGWINDWSHYLDIDPNIICQAHIHRLQGEFTSKGRLLLATGCMCNPMEYQIEQHNRSKPPTIGYVAMIQNSQGITESVELIHVTSGKRMGFMLGGK